MREDVKVRWRYAGITVALLLLLMFLLYQQSVYFLTDLWIQFEIGEYGHGYLVLAICIYLVICNRKRLAVSSPCPNYFVLVLVFLSSALWLAATIVSVEILQPVSLLLMIFSVVWAITGHQAMKLLAFPILFVSFAIPVWYPIGPVLQNFTADVVFWMMRLLEIPAFRVDNTIAIPSGVFSIEEACSGLRYFLAALTLGSLYAYRNYVTLTARIMVVLVAISAAVLANILRVFMVVYAGFVTEMQHPWVSDHLMLGWYLFGALVAILLVLDAYFYKHAAVEHGSAETRVGVDDNQSCAHFMIVAFVSVVLVATGPAIIYLQDLRSDVTVKINLPAEHNGWRAQSSSDNNWVPIYYGAIEKKTDYRLQDVNISLFIAYYPRQEQGKEVINDLNRISDSELWQMTTPSTSIKVINAHDLKEQLIENAQHNKRLVWYWYNIGGWVTTNKYEAKVLQLLAAITGKPQAYLVAASIAVVGNGGVEPAIEQGRKNLRSFFAEMEAPLSNLNIKKSSLKVKRI